MDEQAEVFESATKGCNSGSCSTGSCNKLNVYDWFSNIPIAGNTSTLVEVSFKNGSRKGFYRNDQRIDLYKGDYIIVDAAQGQDIGEVVAQGEIVKLQMKRKKVEDKPENIRKILRKASDEDIENIKSLREKEKNALVQARVISRNLKLDMKVGDVEFQGDGKKATFYYTAEDRVDFRELVKQYAKEFKVKIEMRQIGARQEAGKIGGIGSCGRELCCSSWLTDFSSVSTQAARYQNLSINTDKLSGQCGRLKCCLNYELDTYMDALKYIPKKVDRLQTLEGKAMLIKTDIFKKELTYFVDDVKKHYTIAAEDVQKVQNMNKTGKTPKSLANFSIKKEEEEEVDIYDDLVGKVTLETIQGRSKNKRNRNKNRRNKNRRR